MSRKVAEFYKVSFERFKEDFEKTYFQAGLSEEKIKEMYDAIKLPSRATTASAGYDFYLPFEINLDVGDEIMVPTGIRCRMDEDYALFIMPKSGLGTKSRLIMYNTAALIDADYYNSDNEGHIMIKLLYDLRNSNKSLFLPAGKSFVQGVFLPFGITESDNATGIRNGGFGSTK
ncbi:MAG: deoxyuridine 5'-triphosphate nucleotidohydrolase [Clostridia bacterium]|nr:deoxyuridine 5'-triphosphate nucleotidohydrolase [Clostridia bacterium]